jgi:hypothetical protein
LSRGVSLFEKACDAGVPGGCYNLGLAHQRGHGVAKNPERARGFLQKACELGMAPACESLRAASKTP